MSTIKINMTKAIAFIESWNGMLEKIVLNTKKLFKNYIKAVIARHEAIPKIQSRYVEPL
jgi:hypothetical protein